MSDLETEQGHAKLNSSFSFSFLSFTEDLFSRFIYTTHNSQTQESNQQIVDMKDF